MDVNTILSTLTHAGADWIILGVLAAGGAFDALRTGVSRAAGAVLALILAPVMTDALGAAAILGPLMQDFSTPVLQAALFGFMFVITYLMVRRLTFDWSDGGGKPIQALLSGIALAAVFAATSVATPALIALLPFGVQVQDVFGDPYRFWWTIAALVALAFARD